MHRSWTLVAAITLSLGLGGLPVAAQDEATRASPAPPSEPSARAAPNRALGLGGLLAIVGSMANRNGPIDPTLVMVFGQLAACTLEPAGDAQSACQLDAVRESRFAAEVASSPGAAAAITRILRGQCAQLTGMHGGACRALLSGVDECASVTDAFERDLCQGYVIEADCETPTPAEFTIQACLFGRAMATGSLVACALLEDADARHLCEARVNGSAASCRRLSRPDLVKRCRQALRDGTTPSLTWLKGGDAAASPSPGASVGQKPAVASEPPTAEGDPCADAEPNDPICSLQDP